MLCTPSSARAAPCTASADKYLVVHPINCSFTVPTWNAKENKNQNKNNQTGVSLTPQSKMGLVKTTSITSFKLPQKKRSHNFTFTTCEMQATLTLVFLKFLIGRRSAGSLAGQQFGRLRARKYTYIHT
jgi:hypothetical protein